MQEIDTLAKYGQSFQSKVVSALLTDNKFLDTISDIAHTKFFENEANKWIVGEIIDYHSEYKKPPTLDVFKSLLTKVDNDIIKTTVVEQLRHIYTQVGKVDFEYVKNEFTDFCKNQNLKNGFVLTIFEYDKMNEQMSEMRRMSESLIKTINFEIAK